MNLKDESEPAGEKDKAEALQPLIEKLKATLGDRVKDVRVSVRLADSPSCVVTDEDDPSFKMQQMMRAMGAEGCSRAEADARDQPGPRDCEEAAGAVGRQGGRGCGVVAVRPGDADGRCAATGPGNFRAKVESDDEFIGVAFRTNWREQPQVLGLPPHANATRGSAQHETSFYLSLRGF